MKGSFKLNVDGASKGVARIAGFGGVIRGDNRRWIAGFLKLGACTAIKSTLWAVLISQKLAIGYNLVNVIVECDSIAIVHLLKKLQAEGDAAAG